MKAWLSDNKKTSRFDFIDKCNKLCPLVQLPVLKIEIFKWHILKLIDKSKLNEFVCVHTVHKAQHISKWRHGMYSWMIGKLSNTMEFDDIKAQWLMLFVQAEHEERDSIWTVVGRFLFQPSLWAAIKCSYFHNGFGMMKLLYHKILHKSDFSLFLRFFMHSSSLVKIICPKPGLPFPDQTRDLRESR